jgi:hypothetical protein
LAELKQLRLAGLVAAKEGNSVDSLHFLMDEKYLPAGFAQRPDGSRPLLVGDAVIDSLRGRPGTFLPIPDMTINKATHGEIAAYAEFANGYRRQWRATDPVIVSMSSSPAGRAGREKVALGILVTPYARERYDVLARYLAPASERRIARLPNDALSMEAGLHEGGRQYQVHVGLQDSKVPYAIREGEIEREGAFESTTYFRRNSYAVVNPSGTGGLRLLGRFTRSLEYGGFEVPAADRPRPQSTGHLVPRPAHALGSLLATTVADVLESLFAGSLVEDRGPWTVFGHGAQIRASVLSRLMLEQVAVPAQIRLRMVDVNETAAAPYVHAFTYLESRKISAANAQLMNLLNQQLNVRPHLAQSEAERLLRARLVCPLGGKYQLATGAAAPYWSSSAWTTKSYYDLSEVPRDYRFPFLDWLRGLDVAFNLTPNTLSANVELEVRQNGMEQAGVRRPDLAEDDATDSAKDRRPQTDDGDKRVRRVQDPAEVRPGDTIVILDDQAKLMVGDTMLDVLPKNEQLRVVEIERNWMGILHQKRGKPIRGWVHVRHVGIDRGEAEETTRVLIETSKDGGVWWFPQSGRPEDFDPSRAHQGKNVADLIRSRDYQLVELPRGQLVTEQTLKGFDVVVRPRSFFPYTTEEVKAYLAAVSQGVRLILFGNVGARADSIAEGFGLRFAKSQDFGSVARFVEHPMTKEIAAIEGPWVPTEATPSETVVLAWFGEEEAEAKPVMGYCKYGKGDIVFIGTAIPQGDDALAVVSILEVLARTPADSLVKALRSAPIAQSESRGPPPPRLLAPVKDAKLPQPSDGEWRFEWEDHSEAKAYRIVVQGESAAFPVIDLQTRAPRYVWPRSGGYIADHNAANWTWRVKSQDTAGHWGRWSEARRFHVARRSR